jgi:cytochrome d ubiquinol oxidase subunit I
MLGGLPIHNAVASSLWIIALNSTTGFAKYLWCGDRLTIYAGGLRLFPLVLSGFASAWFVVTANAWMNVPQGFQMADGKVVDADPLTAMLNPATGAQTTHMILAAYMVTGCVVASFYAAALLRGRDTLYHRRAMALGLALGMICAPVQVVVGDWAARTVAETQPVKLAAMEGQFRTEASVPLRLGGLPDENARATRYALEIPGALSWLAYGNTQAVVQGLDDFPPQDMPPVAIVHLAFQVMVAIGTGLVLLALWVGRAVWRHHRLPESRTFLRIVVLSGPLAVVALEAGWVVTEVGRQPWIVQGVMRTAEAVTPAPGIGWVLAATVVIYTSLAGGTVAVLRLLAHTPLTHVGSRIGRFSFLCYLHGPSYAKRLANRAIQLAWCAGITDQV